MFRVQINHLLVIQIVTAIVNNFIRMQRYKTNTFHKTFMVVCHETLNISASQWMSKYFNESLFNHDTNLVRNYTG